MIVTVTGRGWTPEDGVMERTMLGTPVVEVFVVVVVEVEVVVVNEVVVVVLVAVVVVVGNVVV